MTAPRTGLLSMFSGAQPSKLEGLLGADASTYGMLSPEDRGRAKQQALLGLGVGLLRGSSGPSTLGEAIASGVEGAQGGYRGATAQALQGQALQGQQAMLQARRQIVDQFPGSPNETPDEAAARLQQMLPLFIQTGDTEMVTKLTEYLKSVQNGTKPFLSSGLGPDGKPQRVLIGTDGKPTYTGVPVDDAKQPFRREIDRGDKIDLVDENGKVIATYPKGKSPASGDSANQRQDMMEFRMGEAFQSRVKPYTDTASLAREGVELAKAAQQPGTGAEQVRLLFNFIQTLDGTAVRDGERDLVVGASALRDKLQLYIDKYGRGESVVLPPALSAQLGRVLAQVEARMQRRFSSMRADYINRARRQGIKDPEGLFQVTDLAIPGASGPGVDPTTVDPALVGEAERILREGGTP